RGPELRRAVLDLRRALCPAGWNADGVRAAARRRRIHAAARNPARQRLVALRDLRLPDHRHHVAAAARRAAEEVMVLEVKYLSKSFGGLKVIDQLSFGVERGERLALIGPNGAGKTTVFNL